MQRKGQVTTLQSKNTNQADLSLLCTSSSPSPYSKEQVSAKRAVLVSKKQKCVSFPASSYSAGPWKHLRCPFACQFLRLVVAFPAGVSCLRMFAFPESFSNVVHATDETARDNFDVSPLPVLEPTYFNFFIDRRPFASAFRRLEASQASSLVLTGCELTSQHAIMESQFDGGGFILPLLLLVFVTQLPTDLVLHVHL